MGMFPKLNGKSHLGVKIPALSGGLNEFDAVNLVDDNQLTRCENLWFDGGMLKTRPGFALKQEGVFQMISQDYGNVINVKYIQNDITVMLDGKLNKLIAAICECSNKSVILFYFVSGEGTVHPIPEICESDLISAVKYENCLLCQYKDKIYAYVKKSVPYYDEKIGNSTKPEYKVFFYDFKAEEWQDVEADENEETFEVPLTMTNCRQIKTGRIFSGDSVRGYNLLNGGEKIEMFAFPKRSESDSSYFLLMFDIKTAIVPNSPVKMEIIKSDGTTDTYLCTAENNYKSETASYDTYLTVGVEENIIHINLRGSDGTIFDPMKDQNNVNRLNLYRTDQPNVTLTYYREVTEEEKDRIFMATKCEWFGTEGINGGSRLFVGGNTNPELKNLLHFSDSLNPLYFPENCYMRVGDNSQGITALAKQSEMLVIFSERQLHYITYQSGANVTAEDITENGQYDLTVLNATFPLTQINDKIGCDCPDTVQLCRNRLVWATKEGKVYVLMGASQYSERNVYELSRNIERNLKAVIKDSGNSELNSCDWQGKYVLQAGSKIFVMDYDENAFAYISSYSDSVKAQKNIVWHVWDTGMRFEKLFSDGQSIMAVNRPRRWCELFVCDGTTEKDNYCSNLSDDGYEITNPTDFVPEFKEKDIAATLQTKVFDFNNPGTKKSVDQVYIGFGGNGEKEINVTFVSEKGEQYRSLFPHCADLTPFSAGYVSVERFLPCLAHITRLGIKIESKGNLSINNITINYRLLGGVR